MDFLLDKKIKSWLNDCKQIISKTRDYDIDFKSSYRDLVTDVDKKIEEYLTNKIKGEYPDHFILGEESASEFPSDEELEAKNLWIIDPIDGTSNFVKQNRDYCTMIAYFENNKPVFSYIYDYTNNEMISAFAGEGVFINEIKLEKPEDISMSEAMIALDSRVLHNRDFYTSVANTAYCLRVVGASGLDGTRVAKGAFGGYINLSASPWDYAPFILIASELGLHISKPYGEDLDFERGSGFIISTHNVYEDLNRMMKA